MAQRSTPLGRPPALVVCSPFLSYAVLATATLSLLSGCPTTSPGQPVMVEAPAPDPVAGEPAAPTEGGGHDLVIGEDACETDDDCVPAECCHAAACVASANAPACGDAMCTMECRYGTLDCGGACLCHEGRCAARLSEPPNLQ
jgi:hypothetical protein